jgi:hypothetical protein
VFGEVFHESQDDRAEFFCVRGQFYRDGEDGAEFLREAVFGGSPQNVRAVGFKLMYYQARENESSLRAWEMLRGDTEIRVVHLCRWNLLECFCSHEVAYRSQQWYLPVGGEQRIDVPPFSIEPRRFIGFCESVLSWRTWAKRAFAEHRIIEVQYERDLCHDFSEAIARIQGFLGLRTLSLRPRIRKQAVMPLNKQVSNFVELRAACRHTVGEEFF